ncbi:MAG: sigma-70 family RNA polymerase sigma factor [Aureliella sp.]
MPSLSELIREAQLGNQVAAEILVLRYRDTIEHECAHYNVTKYADLSQSDLVQEILLRVWVTIYQFRGGNEEESTAAAFESWIRKNARSVLSNLYRNRSAQKRVPENGLHPLDEDFQADPNPESSPSSVMARAEEVERLKEAMNVYLDERTREIVNRHIVDGKAFKSIAAEMSLTYDQVRYAFHGAHAKLERWLS